mgnify:CR=1 FL=1
MDYKKILTGLLSRAYKTDNGTLAELLDGENLKEDDILNKILDIDTQRVATLKAPNGDGTFQQGYAKAKKEVLEAFETQLKDEFKIETEKTGLDLITEIVTNTLKDSGKGGEITDDDVKKHPIYQTAERNYKKLLADTKTQYETEISNLKTAQAKDATFQTIKEKANLVLDTLKPILSQNPKVANTIKSNFLNELKGYDYELQADGSILVTKDGKVVDDNHGHSKDFDALVKEVAGNYFDFQGNNGGSNAGNQNGDNGGQVSPKFKSQKEADDYMLDEKIPIDDRVKAIDEWNASQQQ